MISSESSQHHTMVVVENLIMNIGGIRGGNDNFIGMELQRVASTLVLNDCAVAESYHSLKTRFQTNDTPSKITSVQKQIVSHGEVRELLINNELIKNMIDTFSRLELTNEFKHWKDTHEFKERGLDVQNKV